jgi:PhnB protein
MSGVPPARKIKQNRRNMSDTYKPENYHTVTPALICKDAAAAIEFYRQAFDAKEMLRLEYPQGGIGHAELMIGDSMIMLADEHPDMNYLSPTTVGNTTVSLHIYVEDADAVFARAIAAGVKETRPVQEQFYGDRTGHLEDPYGHRWGVSTMGKRMSTEELLKVWDDMMKSGKKECG